MKEKIQELSADHKCPTVLVLNCSGCRHTGIDASSYICATCIRLPRCDNFELK